MYVALGVIVIIVGLTLIAAGLWLTFRPRGDASTVRVPSVIVQGPAGMGIIVLGLFSLAGGAYLSMKTPQGPTKTPIPAPVPTISHTPNRTGPLATLKYPRDGTDVSRQEGFVARGTASSLGSYTIWILDYDGGYTVDQKAIVSNATWSAIDRPLGSSSDRLPYNLTMVAVFADPPCAHRLMQVNSTENDYMNHLPAGCKIFSQVTVNVSKP